jgi:hypothetical protein
MSSMSQNAAQTAPASIAKPKNKLFGLSREELKIVRGGGGIIITDPELPGGIIITSPLTESPLPATEPSTVPATLLAP